MNAGSFLKYIKTPSLLHQLSYEELKTIVLQYPFSSNLHLLLLLKSKLDNHNEYDKNLAMAATYSIDRDYLFRLLQNPELESLEKGVVLKEEDVLELRELSSLEEELTKEPILLEEESNMETIPPLELVLPIPTSETDTVFDQEAQPPAREEEPLEKEEEPDVSAEVPDGESGELLDTMNALNSIIMDMIEHEEKSEGITEDEIQEMGVLSESLENFLPDPKEHLEVKPLDSETEEEIPQEKTKPKLVSEEPVEQEIADPKAEEPTLKEASKEQPKVKEKRTTKKKVSEIASKSIKSQSRVASETLALILEKQGLTDQAIKMYEQLILTFPEKSAYFAAKIENLKNL